MVLQMLAMALGGGGRRAGAAAVRACVIPAGRCPAGFFTTQAARRWPPHPPAEGSNMMLKVHRLRQDVHEHLASLTDQAHPHAPTPGFEQAVDFEQFYRTFWPQVGRRGCSGGGRMSKRCLELLEWACVGPRPAAPRTYTHPACGPCRSSKCGSAATMRRRSGTRPRSAQR